MSKCVAAIPLSAIARLSLVEAGGRSMAQVKEALGCDWILNAWFYSMATGKAVGNLKIDGAVKAEAPWNSWGMTWDAVNVRMDVVPDSGGRNYLSGVELLTPGRGPGAALSYDPAYGGKRGRSAMMVAGRHLILYCSGDGTGDAKTPEGLRDELVEIGGQYADTASLRALGLDSGGSSQCDFSGGRRITSARRVAGYLCVWLRAAGNPPEKEESMGKYRVTPSVGVNARLGPGTSYGKVGAYPMGAVVEVLTIQDGWGRTAEGWVSMAYLEAAEPRATDTGLEIQADYIPAGRKNRPGGTNPGTYITIHETGNPDPGADGLAHAAYLKGAAEDAFVSWHYTVDDRAIVQHLPDWETAYHAGDGADGPGNAESIGVEICVNAGGDFEAAKANAAALVRLLMAEHHIPVENVVQHNRWSGKDCPHTIRHTEGAWEDFLALCRGTGAPASALDEAVDKLAAAGLINSPDYWKAGDYSAENVQALLIKWAASL